MANKTDVLRTAALAHNPAWAQLLGLCPLLAVSSTVVNALGLATASAFVVIGSNVCISALRRIIPDEARLPCFVLVIATFTTVTALLLEAFAYDLYMKIALFVQIIVTNCMILGRAEAFASKRSVGDTLFDATGTALGFAAALLIMGTAREILGFGTLLADAELLFGAAAAGWEMTLTTTRLLPLAAYPPGAFLVAGLLFALLNHLRSFIANAASPTVEESQP